MDGNRLDKPLLEAINSVLDRAEAGAGLGAAKSKADRRMVSDAWDLHWTALISARNSLQGDPSPPESSIQVNQVTSGQICQQLAAIQT